MDGRNPPQNAPFPLLGSTSTGGATTYTGMYLGGTVRFHKCCKDNLVGPGINARNGRSVDMLLNVVPTDKQNQYSPYANLATTAAVPATSTVARFGETYSASGIEDILVEEEFHSVIQKYDDGSPASQ
eukprot:1460496-Prymnesium_polylepis.1